MAGKFPDTQVPPHPRVGRSTPATHPFANIGTDRSLPPPEVSRTNRHKSSASRSDCTVRRVRRNPGLPTTRDQTNAGPRTSRPQTPSDIVAHRDRRCAESRPRPAHGLGIARSRRSSRAPGEAFRSARAPTFLDTRSSRVDRPALSARHSRVVDSTVAGAQAGYSEQRRDGRCVVFLRALVGRGLSALEGVEEVPRGICRSERLYRSNLDWRVR